MNDLAIIILNYNSEKDTIRLIADLINEKVKSSSIFLIDNFSNNRFEIGKNIRKFNINFIQSKKNGGYAYGNNLGIKEAVKKGFHYFLLLNPDIIITNRVVENLYKALVLNSKIGVVGPRICYKEQPNLIYSDGGIINDKNSFLTSHINYRIKIEESVNDDEKGIDFINGSAVMFKKEILDKIGYLNEKFFMYYEETAWCMEIREKGFKLSVLKDSVVYHESSNNGALYRYYMFRNRFLLIKKYNINVFYKSLLKEIKLLLKYFYFYLRYNKGLPEDYLLKWKAIGYLVINKI